MEWLLQWKWHFRRQNMHCIIITSIILLHAWHYFFNRQPHKYRTFFRSLNVQNSTKRILLSDVGVKWINCYAFSPETFLRLSSGCRSPTLSNRKTLITLSLKLSKALLTFLNINNYLNYARSCTIRKMHCYNTIAQSYHTTKPLDDSHWWWHWLALRSFIYPSSITSSLVLLFLNVRSIIRSVSSDLFRLNACDLHSRSCWPRPPST